MVVNSSAALCPQRADQKLTSGMGTWGIWERHATATLAKFQVPEAGQRDVVAFVQSLKKEIVEQARQVESQN